MKILKVLTVGAVLVAAAVAAAAGEERIETIVVTAKPVRAAVPVVEKVTPAAEIEVAAPVPTDMPEAEIDFHMPVIGEAAPARKERATS